MAVQNFRNIVIWMGDRPAQECQRIASRESVVNLVSSDPLMRDEVFTQLLKQLNGNPSPRSEWLGWQLLLQVCKTTPPSNELDDFVRFFCAQERVGVKHWKDFAFFQATNQSDSLRMLPDMLPVSELISMWQQIREATNLEGHLHWRRRFLKPQEL
eukprot:g12081.t1